ncbi:unnamed protein product [Pleuronectes platessa]|uniref:Uncharacterized protein n=1 Tax=Pleuronectes platessa TaxID=8262 RepID=A0A9N7YMD0_PLEPL|nr:unnamed protein product [Pleuronectes platessa]
MRLPLMLLLLPPPSAREETRGTAGHVTALPTIHHHSNSNGCIKFPPWSSAYVTGTAESEKTKHLIYITCWSGIAGLCGLPTLPASEDTVTCRAVQSGALEIVPCGELLQAVPKDLNLHQLKHRVLTAMTFMHNWIVKLASRSPTCEIEVFLLRPGASIPLHVHPDMNGNLRSC